MSLLWRVISAGLGLLLRAGSLFLCLFLVHLLVTRGWPALRHNLELAGQRPVIEQQLKETEGRLSRDEETVGQLNEELAAAFALQLRRLEEGVSEYEHELNELAQEHNALAQRLREGREKEAEYCSSWNPLKRYLCSEIKAQFASTQQAVQPLIDQAERTKRQLTASLEDARAQLAEFRRDGSLPDLATPKEQALRLALYERQARSEQLRVEIERLRAQLAVSRAAEASPAAWLAREVRRVGWGLLAIVVAVLLLPFVHRTLAYFVFMPLVQRSPALRLIDPDAEGSLVSGPSVRSLSLELGTGENCWCRAAYVRPVEGRTRSQWLFDWGAPFVSYAAGLSVLTRIEGPRFPGAAPSRATLASSEDPDSYLLELRLLNHPGLVVHPKHVVALAGDVQLDTIWRPFSVHAWATGQLRFILVRGSGRCILEGRGDVTAGEVKGSRARIEQENVLGFDTRLGYATARTETFLPYLLGRTPLVTDVFCGRGLYLWQKNARLRGANFAERSFDAVFGAVGKLLGF